MMKPWMKQVAVAFICLGLIAWLNEWLIDWWEGGIPLLDNWGMEG